MREQILSEIPESLLSKTFEGDTVAPSFKELEELAAIDGIEKRVLTVWNDNDELEACAICNVETRQHHGMTLKVYALFGYLIHDYCRLYSKSPLGMERLKLLAISDARKCECDLIAWTNIPQELVHREALPTHAEVKVFTASKSDRGWSRFYNSKHIKYFINKINRVYGGYHVEIIDGNLSDYLMEELSLMHIERWRFAGSGSPFLSNPHRKAEYRAHPQNKHYLRVMAGNEIVGCHYGMIYGNTLLFHTPIVNPKFLDLSPLKLILAETARYCEEKGIDSIDFGHGDEAYKDGYCTLPRVTCQFVKPITLKGRAAELLGRLPKERIVNLRNKVVLFNKKNTNQEKPEIMINILSGLNPEFIPTPDVVELKSWEEFCDFYRAHNLPLYKWQYTLFHENKDLRYILSHGDGEVLASAWLTNSQSQESDNPSSRLFDINYSDENSLNHILEYAMHLSGGKLNIPDDSAIKKVFEKLNTLTE